MLTTTTLLTLLTTALAAPSLVPRAPSEIQPSASVTHDTHWSGQNVCNPPTLSVTKTNTGHDLTALLTFTYPAAALNKQCWLEFNVPSTATVSPTGAAGTAKIDVFRQWAPVNTCPSQGNNRDVQLGRLVVPGAGQLATWEVKYNTYLTGKGPCKAPGTVEGIELVGVNDAENVSWRQGAGVGVRVLYE